jgi:hypothetical protein
MRETPETDEESTSASLGPTRLAAAAIVIAAASNNVIEAIYALSFADRTTGRRSLALLIGLSALGIIPLAWIELAAK